MTCRYEVTLNNVTMASLDSSILIHDVQYEAPNYERNLFKIANLQGRRPGKAYKERAAVKITFEIHEYDTDDRQGVLTKIINWAKNGGDLRINDRPGQKLICVCDEFPVISSVCKWTDTLSITFAAYDIPYWQSVDLYTTSAQYRKTASTTKADTFQHFTLDVPGDAMFAVPRIITVEDFTTGESDIAQIYLEMENYTRDDGLMAVTYPLPTGVTADIEYSYDEQQIMTFDISYGTTVETLQGRYNSAVSNTCDLWLSCGKQNDVGLSLTKRGYNSSSQVVYTPLNADVEMKWRGYWE